MLTVERYRKTRFWALYEAGELLCVTVYKKGAHAVKARIERNVPIEHVLVARLPEPPSHHSIESRRKLRRRPITASGAAVR